MQQHENNFKALFVVDDESNNSSPSKETPLGFKDNNHWNDGFFKIVNQTSVQKSYQEVKDMIREPVIHECESFRATTESQETTVNRSTPSHVEEDVYSEIKGWMAQIPEKENKRTVATPGMTKKDKSKQKKNSQLLQINTSLGNVHLTPPKALTFDDDEDEQENENYQKYNKAVTSVHKGNDQK